MKHRRFQKALNTRRAKAMRYHKRSRQAIRRSWGRHIWRSLYRSDMQQWNERMIYCVHLNTKAYGHADRDHEWAVANGYPLNAWDDDFRSHGGYEIDEHLADKPDPAEYPPSNINPQLYAGCAIPPQFAAYLETNNGRWIHDDNGAYVRDIRAKKIWRLREQELKTFKRAGLLDSKGFTINPNQPSILNRYEYGDY